MQKATIIDDKGVSLLTKEGAILERWTEYCQELYNYQLQLDTSILD